MGEPATALPAALPPPPPQPVQCPCWCLAYTAGPRAVRAGMGCPPSRPLGSVARGVTAATSMLTTPPPAPGGACSCRPLSWCGRRVCESQPRAAGPPAAPPPGSAPSPGLLSAAQQGPKDCALREALGPVLCVQLGPWGVRSRAPRPPDRTLAPERQAASGCAALAGTVSARRRL